MAEHTYCRTCRFWSLLRDRAVIGRCLIAERSGLQFPRGTQCCGCWESRPGHAEERAQPEAPPTQPRPGAARPRR